MESCNGVNESIKIDREKRRKGNQAVLSMSMSVQELCESLKEMSAEEILSVMVACVASMKKSLKGSSGKKERKKGSMPKGEVPQQLVKPRAWVELTLEDAKTNGWEAFQVRTQKKDKATGEVTESITEMPESEEHNGTHIFKGSISEKTPNGKQLIHKDAMSLSKQRWAPKEQKGTHKGKYEAFEAKFGKQPTVEIDMTPPTAAIPVAAVAAVAAPTAAPTAAPAAQEKKNNKRK